MFRKLLIITIATQVVFAVTAESSESSESSESAESSEAKDAVHTLREISKTYKGLHKYGLELITSDPVTNHLNNIFTAMEGASDVLPPSTLDTIRTSAYDQLKFIKHSFAKQVAIADSFSLLLSTMADDMQNNKPEPDYDSEYEQIVDISNRLTNAVSKILIAIKDVYDEVNDVIQTHIFNNTNFTDSELRSELMTQLAEYDSMYKRFSDKYVTNVKSVENNMKHLKQLMDANKSKN